jgi:hypothetical protein
MWRLAVLPVRNNLSREVFAKIDVCPSFSPFTTFGAKAGRFNICEEETIK